MKKIMTEEVGYFLKVFGVILAIIYVFCWLYFYSPLEGGLWEASLVGGILIFIFGLVALNHRSHLSKSLTLFATIFAWVMFFSNIMPMFFQKGGIYSKKEKCFVDSMPLQHPLDWRKNYLVKDISVPGVYLFGDDVCDLLVTINMDDSSFFGFVEELLLNNPEAKNSFIKGKVSEEIRGVFPAGYCEEKIREMPEYVSTYFVVREGGFN